MKLIKFFRSLPQRVITKIYYSVTPHVLAWKIKHEGLCNRRGKVHGLPQPLVVSLTSYPARFPTLPLTLKCLLKQTVKPDRLILWIAYEDGAALTPDLLDLQKAGLEIQFCDDLRSFNKIIPTLQHTFDAFIVTADDDHYYWPTWLEELVQEYKGNDREVLSHRAHRIRIGSDGLPLPYNEWEAETRRKDTSPLNFPTGCGGVLYPPGVFSPEVLKVETFKTLCPRADDVWLYWMICLNGGIARKIGRRRYLVTWPNSQTIGLFHSNVNNNGNDGQIEAMIRAYGFPLGESSENNAKLGYM